MMHANKLSGGNASFIAGARLNATRTVFPLRKLSLLSAAAEVHESCSEMTMGLDVAGLCEWSLHSMTARRLTDTTVNATPLRLSL